MADISQIPTEQLGDMLKQQIQPVFDPQGGGARTLGEAFIPPGAGIEPPSPLSITERIVFAFGDAEGKKGVLREKFPTSKITQKKGEFFIDGRAIDPNISRNPFEEFVADVGEFVPEIPRATGGAIGFIAGGGPNPLGVALSGLGAATGEAFNQILGRFISFPKEKITPKKIAKRVARRLPLTPGSLVVATGRELIKPFRVPFGKGVRRRGEEFVLLPTPPFIGTLPIPEAKQIGAVGLTESAATAAGSLLIKMFRGASKLFLETPFRKSFATLSNVPEQAIKEVQIQGAERIFTRENLKPRKVLELGRKLKRVLLKTNKVKGDLVAEARRGLGKTRIRIDDVADDFATGLREANIIDATGRARPIKVFTKTGKVAKFEKIAPNTARNRLIKINDTLIKADRITQSDALALREQLDTLIKEGSKGQITIGTQENALIVRLRSQLADKLSRSSNAFATANKEFTEFRTALDNASDIFGDFKDKSIESNFKTIFREGSPQVKLEALENLERLLPTENRFLDELKRAVVANEFLPTTPPRSPAGLSVRSLTGISPRTVGKALRGQRRISRFVGQPISQVTRESLRPLLRGEITRRAAQRSLQREDEIQAQPIIRER